MSCSGFKTLLCPVVWSKITHSRGASATRCRAWVLTSSIVLAQPTQIEHPSLSSNKSYRVFIKQLSVCVDFSGLRNRAWDLSVCARSEDSKQFLHVGRPTDLMLTGNWWLLRQSRRNELRLDVNISAIM